MGAPMWSAIGTPQALNFSFSSLPLIKSSYGETVMKQINGGRLNLGFWPGALGLFKDLKLRALARLLATSDAYPGPVLFNPGGPGVGGVEFVMGQLGDHLYKLVDPNFDIVLFDTRLLQEGKLTNHYIDSSNKF